MPPFGDGAELYMHRPPPNDAVRRGALMPAGRGAGRAFHCVGAEVCVASGRLQRCSGNAAPASTNSRRIIG